MNKVFFVRAKIGQKHVNLLDKFSKLMSKAGEDFIRENDLTAIKLHMGERGSTRFLKPVFVKRAVEWVKNKGAMPFLTDSCTLYHEGRNNGVSLIEQAIAHGFSHDTVGASVVPADGINGHDYVTLQERGRYFKEVKICSNPYYADSMIVLSHFKCHLAAGFGGALKNLAMGLGSKAMKQAMHADTVKPVHAKNIECTGCGVCVEICPSGAIMLKNLRAEFVHSLCIGCGDCIAYCQQGAIKIIWAEKPEVLGEKMMEVALASLSNKKNRVVFFNFLMDVTPDCDCLPWSDNPIVEDIGILASPDPVAIDFASCKLVNECPGLAGSVLKTGLEPGGDKFRALHPRINWENQLTYAEEIGLGSRQYELHELVD